MQSEHDLEMSHLQDSQQNILALNQRLAVLLDEEKQLGLTVTNDILGHHHHHYHHCI